MPRNEAMISCFIPNLVADPVVLAEARVTKNLSILGMWESLGKVLEAA